MKRIKLTVAYDGTNYCGWQIQPNAVTIEEMLDKAIQELTGETVHVTGASRTDTGVHALGNVAVFDTESTIPGDRFTFALNRFLPEDISVVESHEVKPDFHPRHCNTRKTYEYRFYVNPHNLPQVRNSSWHVPEVLDIEKMRDVSRVLIGEHDFKAFCSVHTDALTTVRTVYSIDFREEEMPVGKTVVMRITGNGFLYNMVRIIAGTMCLAGKGKITKENVEEILNNKDRCHKGQTAPPQGLTLVGIEYVDGDDLPVDNSFSKSENVDK